MPIKLRNFKCSHELCAFVLSDRHLSCTLTIRFVYLLQNEESCQEAADMSASLLWNRDSTLTGQVFLIR